MNPLVMILALLSLVGFVYIFIRQRKYLALYVISIVLFLPKINILLLTSDSSAGLRTDDLIIAFFMLFTVIGERCKSYQKVFSNNIFKFFVLFIISSGISFIVGLVSRYTYSISLSFFGFLRKIEYFCFIFVGYDLFHYHRGNTRPVLKKMLNVFTVFTAVISLFQVCGLIGSFRFGVYDGQSFRGWAVGMFNGHYELGAFFVIASVIYFYDIIKNVDKKWESCVYLAVSLLLIFFSKSRTSLLVVVAILFLMILVYCNKKIKISALISGISVFCLFVILVKFSNIHLLDRFRTLHLDTLWDSVVYYFKHRSYAEYLEVLKGGRPMEEYVIQTGDVSFNVRMFKWMAMLDVLIKFPLCGYGFGSNSVMDGNYVKLLAENGLFGFALFIMLLILIIKQSFLNKQQGYVMWIMISVCLGAILIDLFEASKVMEFVWFLIGVCCIEGKNVKEEIRQEIVSEKQVIQQSETIN